ncbi:MAG: hypothetical protein ABJF01_05700 [bacterium]
MRDDESHTEHGADLALLIAEVEREAARVGVDFHAASERMRGLARQEEHPSADGSSFDVIELDVGLLVRTLRSLPAGVGTDAFIAACAGAQSRNGSPPN